MSYEDVNLDELLSDVQNLLDGEATTPEEFQPEGLEPSRPEKKTQKSGTQKSNQSRKSQKSKKTRKVSGWRRALGVIGKIFLILLETVLLVVIALYGLMYVVAKGPSPTARDLFVMSVRETSAVGWLANLYFTDEEIAQIENRVDVEEYTETDTSLIQIPKETAAPEGETVPVDQGPQPDEWGLVDEDGDGIILQEVKGEGYSGYMMVVLDPSRVIMGSKPGSYGGRGYTVEQMVKEFDAVAGTNAGGFYDPDGTGNGSIPDTMVVFEGKVYYEGSGVRSGFVGFDDNHIMHVATRMTSAEVKEKNIQYGVCFGPVLVSNGEPCNINISGVNPRTAIGQRSDGAVLMLVIDGRQVISMGATYQDLIDIMLDFGAVNACNLDGGSSTLMWWDRDGDGGEEGDYVNNCASVIGIRPVPTTFLVLKEGVKDNG